LLLRKQKNLKKNSSLKKKVLMVMRLVLRNQKEEAIRVMMKMMMKMKMKNMEVEMNLMMTIMERNS